MQMSLEPRRSPARQAVSRAPADAFDGAKRSAARIAMVGTAVAAFAIASHAAERLPKNIVDQLPAGYVVKTFKRGLLDADQRPDYLVAIARKGEQEAIARGAKAARRPLLIFVQQDDGSYRMAARNDRVAYAADEGGQCDPFDGESEALAIRNRYFTVQNAVACGAHWTDYLTFRWDAAQSTWLFQKRITESWGLNNGNKPDGDALVLESRRVTNARVDAPKRFEEYDPR